MNDKFFPVSCFRGVGQGEQGPEPIPAAQARCNMGTNSGQDTLPWQGTITYTHSTPSQTVETCQFASRTHLWVVGGNGVPQRKPAQTWGEHANAT